MENTGEITNQQVLNKISALSVLTLVDPKNKSVLNKNISNLTALMNHVTDKKNEYSLDAAYTDEKGLVVSDRNDKGEVVGYRYTKEAAKKLQVDLKLLLADKVPFVPCIFPDNEEIRKIDSHLLSILDIFLPASMKEVDETLSIVQ